jgi:hypothetical protein
MKTLKIILAFILMTSVTVAQVQKQVRVPISKDSSGKADTAVTYKWLLRDIEIMKLADLRFSQQPFHMRIWSGRSVTDISTNDKKTFNGSVTNITGGHFVSTQDDKGYSCGSGLVSLSKTFDTALARKAIKLIDSFSVFSIPPSDSIAGWGKRDSTRKSIDVADGEMYSIEYSTPTIYSFKSYYAPYSYTGAKEAIEMSTLLSRLSILLAVVNDWNDFINGLPRGSYSIGGESITVKATKKH